MIDAHQHFWQLGRHDCAWPTPDLAAIHRDFMPADLTAHLDTHGIEGTVLVQSQASDADTDFLLALAAQTGFVKGVVGWADMAAAGATERIAALAGDPLCKGLRPMLQGLEDDEYILQPAVAPAIEAMIAHGLSFDALVFTRHLPAIRQLADRYPGLDIIIDHGAKPPLADGDLDIWHREMAAIARRPNIICKLSGLPVEAGPETPPTVMARAIDTLLETFGEERLVWGSDWPVVTLACAYDDWLETCRARTGPSAAIYGGNARRFYRLAD